LILINSFHPVALIGSCAGYRTGLGSSMTKRHHQIPGNLRHSVRLVASQGEGEVAMNGLIYLIGLIVVIMAILSFFGLR
jgi:hypothetical protein